jgi:hypothetical protein
MRVTGTLSVVLVIGAFLLLLLGGCDAKPTTTILKFWIAPRHAGAVPPISKVELIHAPGSRLRIFCQQGGEPVEYTNINLSADEAKEVRKSGKVNLASISEPEGKIYVVTEVSADGR